jgi:hypothetical protein
LLRSLGAGWTSPPNRPDPGRWRASRSVVRHELPGSLHRTSQNAGVIEPAKFIEFFVADQPLK